LSVIVILADGARADAFRAQIDAGALPSLARLRAEGGLHDVSTVFPSVTGPAYVPFLMGRFPGPVGLPGLRWYDRARTRCAFPYARSYLGPEMRHIDGDLDAGAPTIFELAGSRLGSMNMINRGLRRAERLGRGGAFVLRAARTHFSGDVRGWLAIDRDLGRDVARHIRAHRPDFVFAGFTGVDKTSHQSGHESADATEALRIVDGVVEEIRHDAERDGTWERTHLWVVSDHGHSVVHRHDDLADLLRAAGFDVIGHPWVFHRWDVAVMVSGNAMAHLYLDAARRDRPWWPELAPRWEPLAELLLGRASVDLLMLPHSPTRTEIRARGRGRAILDARDGRFTYRPVDGDPLGVGAVSCVDADDAHAACAESDYPDALVQIAALAGSPRAGEIIVSATRGWDYRARYEPIPHASTHGALHREHMLVPLLTSRPASRAPLRTTDVMPSALEALGLPKPPVLDGRSWL
jgi:hypothetical protein